MVNDIGIQHDRNALSTTDLSQVRIEGYTLGQYVTDWNVETHYCTVICENDERFYSNVPYTDDSEADESESPQPVLNSDSPVAVISMQYPTDTFTWSRTYGADIWKGLTIQDKPMPDFDSVVEALGENYVTAMDGRPMFNYYAFIDRENDMELRFSFFGDEYTEISGVDMVRVDNRGWMKFFGQRNDFFDDRTSDVVYGRRIFGDLEVNSVSLDIRSTLYDKQFLFYAHEYFIIPIYYAAWIFPLFWVLYKLFCGKPWWIAAAVVWYPLWWFFGLLTLLVRQ